jgi:hypothetical protein
MPNYVQFFEVGDKEQRVPVPLTQVDAKICAVLKVPCHPQNWHLNWFNHLGLGLAMGSNYRELAKHYENDEDMIKVLWVLAAHYTFKAWSSR